LFSFCQYFSCFLGVFLFSYLLFVKHFLQKANTNVGTSTRNTPKSASKRGRPAKKKARIEEGEDVVEV
jgi:hypothetical protein